jgi:anti-sigma B factor antagonist
MCPVTLLLVDHDRGQPPPDGPTGEQLMTVRAVDHDDAAILLVDGEVDGLTIPRLRAELRAAFDRLHGRALVVDLTNVSFFGSAGLSALADGAAEAIHHHGVEPLRIVVDDTRPVIRPIQLAGLDQVRALYSSVPDALTG